MKSTKLLIFFLLSHIFFCTQAKKNQIGVVLFYWDSVGDPELIIQYKGEEILPRRGIHRHNGGYSVKRAKDHRAKLLDTGKRMVGECYRALQLTISWWEYVKALIWKPVIIGRQKLILFDDGTTEYYGRKGLVERFFTNKAKHLFDEFEQLIKLRFTF